MESPNLPPDPPVTSADLKLLRDRVDLLQVASAEKQKPWYKQRPSLASLLALGFSIISFLISQHASSLQEIRSKQEALQKLLTDIVALKIEAQEQLTRVSDAAQRVEISSAMNNRRIILLDAAESLVDQLGTHVSSLQCQTLAQEKWNDSEFEKAKRYYLKALDTAKDRFGRTVALRALGAFYLQCPEMRNLEEGRKCFQKAVASLGNPTDDHSNYLIGYTYEMWSYGDQCNNLRNDRAEHIKRAREYYSKMSPTNPLRDSALISLAFSDPDQNP